MVQLATWLNGLANALGRWTLAPLAVLPDWLSLTLIAVATGAGLLVCFKHTSQQAAIARVRREIQANLLALWLFRDHLAVSLLAQRRLLVAAVRLLGLAIVPLAVMSVPVGLVLGQLGLWHQFRPLRVGEETVITVQLVQGSEAWPVVQLADSPALQPLAGPVRIISQRVICWNVRAVQPGSGRFAVSVDGQALEKELAIGEGPMRVSATRPGADWIGILRNPGEPPLGSASPVRSISVDYPPRSGHVLGGDRWVWHWFAVAFVAALLLRGPLRVNV